MNFDLVSKLVFPYTPSSYGVDSFPGDLIWVPRSLNPQTAVPEECIPCIFLPYPTARFVILYLHSNAEDIGRCHSFCKTMHEQFQVHVLAVEYPGYGICPGGPCDEKSVVENARVGLRFLLEVLKRPLEDILILGRSIGCGPAISLARHHKVAGLILISPMTSLKDLCRETVGPLADILVERFPNKGRISLIRSPLLVVHGQKDMIIPYQHGLELYHACRTRKLLVCPQDMDHNSNLLANVTYLVLPMLQFFSLPDYCFDDVEVPNWALDKRMSTHFHEIVQPCSLSCSNPSKSSAIVVTPRNIVATPRGPRDVGCFPGYSRDGKGSWELEIGLTACMRNLNGLYSGAKDSPGSAPAAPVRALSDSIFPREKSTHVEVPTSVGVDVSPMRVSAQPAKPERGLDEIPLVQKSGKQPEDLQESSASRQLLQQVSGYRTLQSNAEANADAEVRWTAVLQLQDNVDVDMVDELVCGPQKVLVGHL